jgi:hypothetical protein
MEGDLKVSGTASIPRLPSDLSLAQQKFKTPLLNQEEWIVK